MTNSIRSRFGISLLANLSKAAITFGTGMLVARGLGPEKYGSMMFLLGTFIAIRQLLDMGTSTAFFTFLSQRQRTWQYIKFYLAWLLVQFLLPLIVIGLIFPDAWRELIWKGEQQELVILAFVATFMQSTLWTAILRMGESQRMTYKIQGLVVLIALAHLLLVLLAWWGGWLEIRSILILIIIEWGIAAALIMNWLHFPCANSNDVTQPKTIFLEFWQYCLPLIPYVWVGFAYEFADRWLIQVYAGSVQQAYYSVAYQFGAVAAIATSSILNIFWKEIAEAHHQKNHKRVTLLYAKVTRGLFFIAASAAGFFAPWSETILQITLGPAYIEGGITLAVMLFYTPHQSMGQIGGTMAYATGRVTPYVRIGIVFMLSSIVISYLILAPSDALVPGAGMGSLGLAIKMVALQLVQVNVLSYYLARHLEIRFDWLFQPIIILICFVAGFLSFTASNLFLSTLNSLWPAVLVSLALYLAIMILFVFVSPKLVGLNRRGMFNFLMTS